MPEGPRTRPAWPSGDGEAARRIRAHDWAATALGPVEGWPATLKRAAEIVLGAPMASVLLWGPEHIVAAYNEGYRVILGDKPEALGRPVLQVWAEERELLAPQLSRILDGETLFFRELPMFLKRGLESDQCWFDYGYGPVRDEAGSVGGIIVSILETTDRVLAGRALRESGERQAFLLKLGDALRPLADPAEIEGEATRLLGERLGAGRAYYVEVREAEGSATVRRDHVMSLELAAHGADEGGRDRVRLDGPEVALPARAVQLMALALHELLTNALKHGALGAPGGRLEIAWAERRGGNGGRRLRLDWRESGVAMPEGASAMRRGFGLDLIEATLPYELDAETRLEFGPGGLRCSVELPLEEGPASESAAAD